MEALERRAMSIIMFHITGNQIFILCSTPCSDKHKVSSFRLPALCDEYPYATGRISSQRASKAESVVIEYDKLWTKDTHANRRIGRQTCVKSGGQGSLLLTEIS